MQKNGAGFVTAASTFWDTERDGLCKVRWENQTIICVVTVFGCCVNVDDGTGDTVEEEVEEEEKEEEEEEEGVVLVRSEE